MTLTPDVCRSHHGGNEFSEEANESVHESKSALRMNIFRFLMSREATCDEVEAELAMRHQTCSARIKELRDDLLIEYTGEKRRTRSGRFAAVYRVKRKEPASTPEQIGLFV